MNKEKSVEILNQAVAGELLSIDQYLYFHFHCENRGYEPLAKIFYRIAIVEMKHVDKLASRILFLNGDVMMKRTGIQMGFKTFEDMVKCARALEEKTVNDYNTFATMAAQNEDSATKKLFEDLVVQEEDHYDIFDIEIDNMAQFGDSYLALQSMAHSVEAGKLQKGDMPTE